ncbi:radical SAM protein [Desulfovibrio sp. 6_1_46AFAA]|uniref:radical SAM protein n=1 Tax=Desulfovibrio sp. 6_1_46AFAA TaxID=665942 RepID=UPI0012E9976A|nr:radical SAM protein [Desulfovibrio sp. 6_1_46AFAA]
MKKFKYGEVIYNNYMKFRFFITKKPAMPILEYVVTTKCTMNCKHCNTFIPYFTNQTHVKPVGFEEFKNDLDTILKSVDFIMFLGFVGGEPLLAKDLHKMLAYALKQKKVRHVFLATNCTLLPSKELLEVMKNKKFAVQISDYRNVKLKNNMTVKYDEFKRMCIKNDIRMSNFQEKREAMNWQTMPDLYKDRQNAIYIQNQYDKCWGRYCNMLCDGILTQCTLSVYINRNMEITPQIQNELVDIRKNKNTKELTKKIINFYSRPYSEFCHYCHCDKIEYGLPCGEQVEDRN